MHLHLKRNHPMQFSHLGKKLQLKLQRGRLHLPDSPQSLGRLVEQTKYKQDSAKLVRTHRQYSSLHH